MRVVIFTVMLVVGIPAECTAGERPPILLFDGNGTSPDDVAALRAVLSRAQLRFDTADSPRLNAMSAQELRGYRLLIVPGGNFERIGNALSGAGWVILVGVHPEAPAAWRRGLAFSSPVAQDNAYAETLIRAALAGTRGMVVIDPLTGAMFNLSPDKINQTLRPAEASVPR